MSAGTGAIAADWATLQLNGGPRGDTRPFAEKARIPCDF